MARPTGEQWIVSQERQDLQRRIALGILPFAHVAGALASKAVTVFDGDPAPVRSEERCLIPGELYMITKIGIRHYPLEPQDRISRLLEASMIDELPHIGQVVDGEASLIGPRGTSPTHRERLFEALRDSQADEWRHILGVQQHGVLSTFALRVHSNTDDTIGLQTENELTDEEVRIEALLRFASDKIDFTDASKRYDYHLLKSFTKMVLSRATGGRIG